MIKNGQNSSCLCPQYIFIGAGQNPRDGAPVERCRQKGGGNLQGKGVFYFLFTRATSPGGELRRPLISAHLRAPTAHVVPPVLLQRSKCHQLDWHRSRAWFGGKRDQNHGSFLDFGQLVYIISLIGGSFYARTQPGFWRQKWPGTGLHFYAKFRATLMAEMARGFGRHRF